MSVVSAGDQTIYTDSSKVVCSPVLNLEPLTELATADVDTAPVYPLVSIAVTNTSANWLQIGDNLLFRIEQPDGTIVAWGVTRYAATATAFFPDVKSAGDFGYATNSGITVSAGDTIRVYTNRHIWAMISRVGANGIQYKRWDQAYNGEGRRPPPIANLGIDQTAYVNPASGLASFTFDASNSFDWLLAAPSIGAYAWTLPAGAVVTGGAVDEASVTFTITAGIHQVSCQVTSNNGASSTGYRTIYANDLSANLPFGEQFAIQSIQTDTVDADGWQGQFTVMGDLSAQIYPGQKCLWYVPVTYDGSELTDNNAFLKTNVGYLTDYNFTYDTNGVTSTTLIFSSPLKATKLLPSATQFIEESTAPASWTQVRPGLSHPAYAAFYILKYHTTVLDNHDFFYETAMKLLRRRVFGFGSDNIQAHLETVGVIMSGKVGCRADGSINLTFDPNLQDTTERAARDQKYTWTEDNIRAPLQIQPRLRPNVAYLIMRAVYFNGDVQNPAILFASKAPGNAQMQGVTKTDLPDISLATNSAAELYRIIGHWVAKLNNPLDRLVILPHAMLDICEPADPDWHIINLDDSQYFPVNANHFGIRWSNAVKYLPEQVARQWTNDVAGVWVKSLRVTGRIESAGQPGVFLPTYRGELAPYIPSTGWLDGLDITMPDISPEFNFDIDIPTSEVPGVPGFEFGWAYNDLGLSGVSTDWNGDFPLWTSANSNIDGDVIDQCLDADNPGAGYMLVYDSGADELIAYYNTDIPADPTDWTAQVTISAPSGFHGKARIVNNTSLTLLALVTETYVEVYRKPSGGAWSGSTLVGQVAAADPTGAQSDFGIAIEGAVQVVPGRENTNDGYLIYKATTAAGAFTAIANTPGDNANSNSSFPMLARDGSGNTLVTFGQPGATFGGETRQLTDSSSNPDMIENNTTSIPDRDYKIGYTIPWDVEATWWAPSPGVADSVPARYGRAIIYYTDENAQSIEYTISTFEWRAETYAYWTTSGGSEASVDMVAEVRLLNNKKEILWTTGEVTYNTIADTVILETNPGWDTTLTRRRRGYEATATPDIPIDKVRFWELIVYSANLETFTLVSGGGSDWPEFFIGFVGSPVSAGPPANDGSRIWTIDSKLQLGAILYSIDDATETWTDITPLDENGIIRTPTLHNSVAFVGGTIYAIVSNEDGERFLVTSSDGGTTWEERGDTPYYWLRSLGGDKFVVGGLDRLAVSVNDLRSFTTRVKQWTRIGSKSIFRDFVTGGTL